MNGNFKIKGTNVQRFMNSFDSQALAKGGKEWRRRRTILNRQQQFLDRLVAVMKAVAKESGNRKK